MEFATTNSSSSQSASSPPVVIDPDTKILADLSTVSEKIILCQSMLINIQNASEIDSHESLLTIIGFLEACVPRVRELINVGMTCLKEETLTQCFQVNDDLCKILDDVEHPERVTAQSVDAAAKKNDDDDKVENNASSINEAKASSAVDNFLDSLDFDSFGFEDQKQAVGGGIGSEMKPSATAATSTAASSALEDLLAPPSSVVPTSKSSSDDMKQSSANAASASNKDDDDEFDNFFDNRVDKNSFSIDE